MLTEVDRRGLTVSIRKDDQRGNVTNASPGIVEVTD
jgi:hypothetical protein